MKKRIFVIFMAVLLITAAFTGCTSKENSETDKSPAPSGAEQTEQTEQAESKPVSTEKADKKLVFGVTQTVLGEDYWEACIVGMKDAAEELDVELIIQGAQNNPAKQVEQIENFIAQGVDAIICSPVDVNAILTSVQKCNEAGIPFIFCSRITESFGDVVVDSGVGFDVLEMSKTGADWLVEYAKENNVHLNILEVMGALSDSHSIGCRDGLAEIAAANPDYITVVTQVPTEWDVSKALSGTLTALQNDDAINCIYYHSDAMFSAVQSALMQTNKYVKAGEDGHIVLMACGGTKDTLDAIREGYVDALEVTPIVEVGYESVYQAKRVLDGDVKSGESLLYDAYVLDSSNFEEKAQDVFGYAGEK